jgi:uncharacterized membrane protein
MTSFAAPAADAPQRILALEFDSPPLAHDAVHATWELHHRHEVSVHDLVLVSTEDGRPRVVESMDPTPLAAAVVAALLGALVGALVAGPVGFLIGGVIAGTTGVLVTKLVDTGIPHRLIAQLRRRAKPGQAVLALLVDDNARVDELRHLPGAHVVYDNND